MLCLSANSAAAVKHCHEVKMLRACKPLESNSFCAISQDCERPCRSAATDRSHVSLEKIRKPVAYRLRGAPMPIDQQPPHGLFLKWRKFQIGAFGIPAAATVLVAVLLGFSGRWLAATPVGDSRGSFRGEADAGN